MISTHHSIRTRPLAKRPEGQFTSQSTRDIPHSRNPMPIDCESHGHLLELMKAALNFLARRYVLEELRYASHAVNLYHQYRINEQPHTF